MSILGLIRAGFFKDPSERRAIADFEAAIAPAKSKPWATIKKVKVARKASKRVETSIIRALVVKRSGGFCECCHRPLYDFDPGHLDHARGRVKARQSTENTWLLASTCHQARTNGPREEWLEKYLEHSIRYGHAVEERWARKEIAFDRAKRRLLEATRG